MPLRHVHMALSASLSHPSLRAPGSKTSTRRRATLSPAPRPRALSRGRARCTRWPRRTTRALSSRASTPSKRRDLSILRDSRRPGPAFFRFSLAISPQRAQATTVSWGRGAHARHVGSLPVGVTPHTAISPHSARTASCSRMTVFIRVPKKDDDATQLPNTDPKTP